MYEPLTPPTLGDRERTMTPVARERARDYYVRLAGILAGLSPDEADQVVAHLAHHVEDLRRRVDADLARQARAERSLGL